MCHEIGHFSSQNEGQITVLEVLRSNRRSLYNWTLFCTIFLAVLSKSGARGRGCQESLSRNSVKSMLFPPFSGSGSSCKIRGPQVGALAGTDGNRQEPEKVSSRTPFPRCHTPHIGVLPRLFPQRDSRYNTLRFRPGTVLGLERVREVAVPGPWRPKNGQELTEPAPMTEGAGSCNN